ncbi:hypothetical protein [Reyranella sp.]|uniref:hypothetical protein n=1 Tax=Reyranella sp. TaxID=1929291 RepID=UPI003F70445F
MVEPPATAVHQADALYLSGDRSMSRDLHHQYRRQKQLYCAAAIWPLVLPLLYACIPTPTLIALGMSINDLLWSHFKSISFETCGAKCSLVAFNLTAVALAWVGAVVFGILSVIATIQFRSAQAEALSRGLAPLGKMPDGTPKPLPTGGGVLFMGITTTMLGGAILFMFLYVLYEVGGSDRTVHAKTSREYPPILVSVLATFLVSAVQCFSIVAMSTATFFALDLKKLLKI